ncbi:lysine-sensitive aspartokinase 3 [Fangia hongkongensis]|uniref:lysine-sensitive aspartokinase 3 n=1 Tax=Fangia hongkongensis TaxID=270495 RepID=UPI00037D6BD3|nr:lysine-sensitive aspartokinase 3 [Fangia hongkongensis]MBK2126379.1 lysine-sensitive aspartokinase 3 [Fangia hongkongensis]
MHQSVIVAKFGGTSVANISAIENCVNIVRSTPEIRVVVVSAQSGVTNLLVQLAKAAKLQVNSDEVLLKIRSIIDPILIQLDDESLEKEVHAMLFELSQLCQISSRMHNLHICDEILSFGERISARLMVKSLISAGVNARYICSKSLIQSNSHFGQAEPDIVRTKENVLNTLNDLHNTIYVTEGFIAADVEGNTTTLGRGGSDYSAALISEALEAKALQIWTDVAGVYQVDPRVIPSAKVIETLRFNEAAELATFGAKVLHPATLWPAIRQNIRVFVGSTLNPEAGGTWIVPKENQEEVHSIHAVAERKNQTLLTIKSFDMFQTRGFLANIFAILAKHKVSVDLVTTSEVSVALTIDHIGSQSIGQSVITNDLLTELRALGQVEINIEENMSLIAVVGNRLHVTSGISGQLFSSLKEYNIRLFSHGASGHNICLLVNKGDAVEVIQKIYQQFFIQAAEHEKVVI